MSIVPRRLRAEAVPLSVPFGVQVMDIVSTYANRNEIPSKVFPHFLVLAAAPGRNFFLLHTDWGGISGGLVRGEGLTPCADELRRKGGGLGVALQVGNAGNLDGRGLLGRGVGQPMRSVLRLRTRTHIHVDTSQDKQTSRGLSQGPQDPLALEASLANL